MAITDIELSVGLVPGDVKKTADELGKAIEGVFQSTAGKSLDPKFENLKKNMSAAASATDRLIREMNKLESTKIPTDEYKELAKQVEKDELAFRMLEVKMINFRKAGGDVKSDEFMEMKVQLDELRDSINYAKDEMLELTKAGKDFTLGSDTDAYKSKLEQLGDVNNRTRLLIENWNRSSSGATSSVGQLSSSLQTALQPLMNFNAEISSIASTFSKAFGPYVEIAKKALQILIAEVKIAIKVFSEFVKVVGKSVIGIFKPLGAILKTTGKTLSALFSNIRKHSTTTLKNLLSTMILSGVIVKSLTYLIGQLRAVSGDLINELAAQIPEVNKEMSAFQTALNGLKGSLASAFQPILSAILPALTALINAVSKAIAVVAKFIALLTGQQFVYEATATQVDYAKSLDKTGKSAKKAAKELKGYLSPLDEINKFQSNKDNDSGGGGGADGGAFTMKKVPIEDWIKDFWDRLKQSWEHADFFWLGKMLGDKIAKALANIPWAEIRAKARQLGRSLATLLNGLMYGEFNGKSLATYIGQTIAGAINTAFDFVDSYISEFDFRKFGQSIMEALAGVFDNLDWNLITGTLARLGTGIGQVLSEVFSDLETWRKAGDALARGINSVIYGAFNMLNQIEGGGIGAAISRFLNGFIDMIDANAFVTTFNEFMRDLLDAMIVAVKTTHWEELGEKLAEIINGIDFVGIFKRYTGLANSIIDAILDMLESFLDTLSPEKVDEIGTSIADTINNLDFQPERFGSVANRLLQALFDMVLNAVGGIDWDKVAQDIVDFLDQIDWDLLLVKGGGILVSLTSGLVKIKDAILDYVIRELPGWIDSLEGLLLAVLQSAFTEVGGSIIYGLLDGMTTTLFTGNPVLAVFKAMINAVKVLFGIASPSKVFADIGNNIVLGFINGIKTIVDKAKQVWNSLKTTTISIFNGIWNSIKGVINSILGGVEAMANGIINGLNKAIGAMNNLQFDVPGWVPLVGGNHLGFHIPTLSNISIPRLAQGAVIPPNKEFLAMLGDQKSGTNIETPLSTMVDAFNQALAQNGGVGGVKQITFVLPDRREIAKYAIEGGRVIQTSTGRNPFELA